MTATVSTEAKCDATKVVDGTMNEDGTYYRQHRCVRDVAHPGLHWCASCGEYFHGRNGHVVGLRARTVEPEIIEDWNDGILQAMP